MVHITCIQVDKREAQVSSVISQCWPAQVFQKRPPQEPQNTVSPHQQVAENEQVGVSTTILVCAPLLNSKKERRHGLIGEVDVCNRSCKAGG